MCVISWNSKKPFAPYFEVVHLKILQRGSSPHFSVVWRMKRVWKVQGQSRLVSVFYDFPIWSTNKWSRVGNVTRLFYINVADNYVHAQTMCTRPSFGLGTRLVSEHIWCFEIKLAYVHEIESWDKGLLWFNEGGFILINAYFWPQLHCNCKSGKGSIVMEHWCPIEHKLELVSCTVLIRVSSCRYNKYTPQRFAFSVTLPG